VPAVGITTGQPREVLLEAGACILVEDFHQLLQVARQQEEQGSGNGNGNGSGGAEGTASAPPRAEASSAVRVQA
jgi:hypothetical protein